MVDQYLQANRQRWDVLTPLHLKSQFYDVDAFKKGASSLSGIELKEMGAVCGKSLLHLQCHFGLDTLSLARQGANVTGVDFSETAIAAADSLASEVGLEADFICCNVFDLPEHLNAQFDIVFTSFGVLGWLPDMQQWAQLVSQYLKPGGFLYLLEFDRHFIQLDENGAIQYDYFHNQEPDEEVSTSTYADRAEHPPMKEFWWNHSISDIFSAILSAGMQITLLNEFPYSAYKLNEKMVESSPGKWVHEDLREKIPYMFSVRAHKSDVLVPYGN